MRTSLSPRPTSRCHVTPTDRSIVRGWPREDVEPPSWRRSAQSAPFRGGRTLRVWHTIAALFWITGFVGPTACAQPPLPPPMVSAIRVALPAGSVTVDLHLPAQGEPAPLIVVAHGFLRSRANMSGWGRMLSQEGYVVAVPTLPTHADHRRNARAIGELAAWLRTTPPHAARIDRERLGFVGFSAGGLSTLLAAADDPLVDIWIGLDPVDRDGMGLKAIPRLRADAIILRADPSSCNADGNARVLIESLGDRCRSTHVAGATHVDAEWPTTPLAEWACGASNQRHREAFADLVRKAVRASLPPP